MVRGVAPRPSRRGSDSPAGPVMASCRCFAAAPLQAASKNHAHLARYSGEQGPAARHPCPEAGSRQQRGGGAVQSAGLQSTPRRAATLILTCREPRDFAITRRAFTSPLIRRTRRRRDADGAETVTGRDSATVAPPFRRRPGVEAPPAPPAAQMELIRTSAMPRIDAEL